MNKYKNLEPEAKEKIDEARDREGNILTMVDGFITNKEALILRDILWYARNNGVPITFVPHKEKDK